MISYLLHVTKNTVFQIVKKISQCSIESCEENKIPFYILIQNDISQKETNIFLLVLLPSGAQKLKILNIFIL